MADEVRVPCTITIGRAPDSSCAAAVAAATTAVGVTAGVAVGAGWCGTVVMVGLPGREVR
ncbi:hypothetical protein CUD01_27200 [Cellulomonas uda]|uniref:Uncharacterized protein n=1 Tax=Cellulomonas uda TaxID=1714 RepID=A0A4Y3KF35_CELUD|nr:hypothetical protein CUD01_27200 [Cellulomonas uda]